MFQAMNPPPRFKRLKRVVRNIVMPAAALNPHEDYHGTEQYYQQLEAWRAYYLSLNGALHTLKNRFDDDKEENEASSLSKEQTKIKQLATEYKVHAEIVKKTAFDENITVFKKVFDTVEDKDLDLQIRNYAATTRDGSKLDALIINPRHYTGTKVEGGAKIKGRYWGGKKVKQYSEPNKYTVIFLGNGQFYEDPETFNALIAKAIAENRQIIVFNYRGVFKSEGEAFTFQDIVDDGIDVVKPLIEKGADVTLEGFSLGGTVATKVANHFHNTNEYEDTPNKPYLINRNSFGDIDPVIKDGYIDDFLIGSRNPASRGFGHAARPFVRGLYNTLVGPIIGGLGWRIKVVDDYLEIPAEYRTHTVMVPPPGQENAPLRQQPDKTIHYKGSLHVGVKKELQRQGASKEELDTLKQHEFKNPKRQTITDAHFLDPNEAVPAHSHTNTPANAQAFIHEQSASKDPKKSIDAAGNYLKENGDELRSQLNTSLNDIKLLGDNIKNDFNLTGLGDKLNTAHQTALTPTQHQVKKDLKAGIDISLASIQSDIDRYREKLNNITKNEPLQNAWHLRDIKPELHFDDKDTNTLAQLRLLDHNQAELHAVLDTRQAQLDGLRHWWHQQNIKYKALARFERTIKKTQHTFAALSKSYQHWKGATEQDEYDHKTAIDNAINVLKQQLKTLEKFKKMLPQDYSAARLELHFGLSNGHARRVTRINTWLDETLAAYKTLLENLEELSTKTQDIKLNTVLAQKQEEWDNSIEKQPNDIPNPSSSLLISQSNSSLQNTPASTLVIQPYQPLNHSQKIELETFANEQTEDEKEHPLVRPHSNALSKYDKRRPYPYQATDTEITFTRPLHANYENVKATYDSMAKQVVNHENFGDDLWITGKKEDAQKLAIYVKARNPNAKLHINGEVFKPDRKQRYHIATTQNRLQDPEHKRPSLTQVSKLIFSH